MTRTFSSPLQLDFWPEVKSSAMVALARLSAARPQHCEDVRQTAGQGAQRAAGRHLGKYGESSFPLHKK